MAIRVLRKLRNPALRLVLLLCTTGMSVMAAEVEINPNAPSEYTVQRGDTLWDIAGRFLEEPWLWPQVWQINPQIENPDLIYPGDVIELVYNADGSPVLRLSRSAAPELPTIRYSPRVRSEPILSAIPAISLDDISSFLSRNSVVGPVEFDTAPHILSEESGRRLISAGDTIFGRGVWSSDIVAYDIVRKGREFRNPDRELPLRLDTRGEIIGIEALTVGTAELQRISGDRAILEVVDSYGEIKAGDRLIPRQSETIESRYMPAPPDFDVDAAIISIGTGKEIGGLYDSLILNLGRLDNIRAGQILTVKQPNQQIIDEFGEHKPWEKLKQTLGFKSSQEVEFPGNNIATVLVYRVFNNTSMALVIKNNDAIRLQDRVVTP